MPTLQEIQKTQGTRLDEAAPWDSYASEMGAEKVSPQLAAEIADYASRRYEDAPVSAESQEQLCELREGNEATAKDYQWVKPDEYEDEKARIGTPMHSSDFITRLRSAGVQCWYAQHPHADKLSLLVLHKGHEEPKVICWVQNGWMQELSVMNFDEYGAPLAERRRGWRTPLLQLILHGIISESKANEVFGKPKQTKAYDRYNNLVYQYKQNNNIID